MAVQEYKPIYTAKEVSKLLQVSINTVYQLMNSRGTSLPGTRFKED